MAQPGPSPLAIGCTALFVLTFLTLGLIALTYIVRHRRDRGATEISQRTAMMIASFSSITAAIAFTGALAVNFADSPMYISNPATGSRATYWLLIAAMAAVCLSVTSAIMLHNALFAEAREILDWSRLFRRSKD